MIVPGHILQRLEVEPHMLVPVAPESVCTVAVTVLHVIWQGALEIGILAMLVELPYKLMLTPKCTTQATSKQTSQWTGFVSLVRCSDKARLSLWGASAQE